MNQMPAASRTPVLGFVVASLLVAIAGCTQNAEGESGLPGEDDTQPFSGIAAEERVFFTGTEPYWGGEVAGDTLLYRTAEQPDARAVEVARFAGRGGMSFSGMLEEASVDMTVTPGTCRDGMSDRTYPLVVTLRIGEEVRNGCGWTDRQPAGDPGTDQATG